jgi:hypothetical protein
MTDTIPSKKRNGLPPPGQGAMIEWRKENPKPKMPETVRLDGETDRDFVSRLMDKIGDGVSVEWAEYAHELEGWQLRHETAEIETGLTAAEEQSGRAHEDVCAAEQKLAATRATTMDGLRCKARMSDLIREYDHANAPIAESVVKDLLAL